MLTFLPDILLIAAGYVAAIYTWPAIRSFWRGAEGEIAALRDRALALEARIKTWRGG